jgi:hypothetical protein
VNGAGADSGFEPPLQDLVTLLAYEDPSASPVGSFLQPEFLQYVADQVSSVSLIRCPIQHPLSPSTRTLGARRRIASAGARLSTVPPTRWLTGALYGLERGWQVRRVWREGVGRLGGHRQYLHGARVAVVYTVGQHQLQRGVWRECVPLPPLTLWVLLHTRCVCVLPSVWCCGESDNWLGESESPSLSTPWPASPPRSVSPRPRPPWPRPACRPSSQGHHRLHGQGDLS